MLDNIQDTLNKFGKYVVQQSRSRLTKGKKNASKSLYDSIQYDTKKTSYGYSVSFIMNEYGMFIDQGVKGSKSTYYESRLSKFRYSGSYKMIPPKSLDQWVLRRNVKGVRDEKGRFVSRKSLKFAIAKSIYQKGIKASFFFTKPFEKAFDNLPPEVIQAFGFDIENILEKEI